jgi:hypothetical protein
LDISHTVSFFEGHPLGERALGRQGQPEPDGRFLHCYEYRYEVPLSWVDAEIFTFRGRKNSKDCYIIRDFPKASDDSRFNLFWRRPESAYVVEEEQVGKIALALRVLWNSWAGEEYLRTPSAFTYWQEGPGTEDNIVRKLRLKKEQEQKKQEEETRKWREEQQKREEKRKQRAEEKKRAKQAQKTVLAGFAAPVFETPPVQEPVVPSAVQSSAPIYGPVNRCSKRWPSDSEIEQVAGNLSFRDMSVKFHVSPIAIQKRCAEKGIKTLQPICDGVLKVLGLDKKA